MYYLQLVVAGITAGAIYALAGLGVVLTYKATGVFNFAHGAIAVLAAYVYWQISGPAFEDGWELPTALGALVAVVLVGPALGFLLERAVFRPLQRAGATTVEKLVATLGAFVLLLGTVVAIWGFQVRQPRPLFPTDSIEIGSELRVGIDQIIIVVLLIVICAALYQLFRRTHLGTEIRAVVDRRELAELAAVDADRVSSVAWMMGCTLAALTGVLLSSLNQTLNPYELSLLVIETFSIAVVARLTSLPIAAAAGVGILGVGGSLLNDPQLQLPVFTRLIEIVAAVAGRASGLLSVDLGNLGILAPGRAIGETFNDLKPNLSVLMLFIALLAYRRLDTTADDAIAVRATARRPVSRTQLGALTLVTAAILLVLPFRLDLAGFQYAHQMLALMVIFSSIVAITGFSGQISLGQCGFAGLGAFASARFANAFDLPVIVAMLLGGVVCLVAGLLAGYPALRRRGLFLGLTTLAIGLLFSRFVFESSQFAGGVNGLQVKRPSVLGIDLDGDTAFYFFELVVLVLILALTRNLRSGRLGRGLAAMRDSEEGAKSVGIDLRAYKLFIFSISAFIAGIGGALLSQQARAFSFRAFLPLNSLFWFAAVVVAGVGSVYGAVLAGFLYVLLDIVLGAEGVSQAVIGLAALVLGLLPGRSLIGLARHLNDRLEASWLRYRDAAAERAATDASPVILRPTSLALRLLGRPAAAVAGPGPTGDPDPDTSVVRDDDLVRRRRDVPLRAPGRSP